MNRVYLTLLFRINENLLLLLRHKQETSGGSGVKNLPDSKADGKRLGFDP